MNDEFDAFIVFKEYGQSNFIATLIHKNGEELASHICSHVCYMADDLWEKRRERKKNWPDLKVNLRPMTIEDFKKEHPVIFDKAFVISEDEKL